jgi:hypothetical protein
VKLALLLKIYIIAAFVGVAMLSALSWPLRSAVVELRKRR